MTSPTKSEMRAQVLQARRKVTPEAQEREAAALAAHLAGIAAPGRTVCAYVPIGSEPGSLAMLHELLARGTRVLLPVARHDETGVPAPLRWGEYRPGRLVDAQFGLREPAPPWLTADAVADAEVVLVPALAVDRCGVRLGRGAGFYDRSLGRADSAASLVAVVRDEEVIDRVPAEAHDVRMTHALTPGCGLVALRESQ
ncbi:5-formyltetrahydrofolate cyclo-ligase [Mycolicibacterium monacense]|uniref:5-formyltetrahydrofolate cyclo-ligase n=1 Tax=Mycolicibacterium monacense TaxID=85693 RepID=UPI0007E978E9|nr:5-formyltetrahydrofolate cyclo-ligase [Mycolicibacterium monacense]OBF50623.1 5-formyltetrahydrofolate cyclo-ligase [Mycolicibacterium monacense]